MALPLSLESLLTYLRIQAFLGAHLLEARVLFFQLLQARHHRRVHAIILARHL